MEQAKLTMLGSAEGAGSSRCGEPEPQPGDQKPPHLLPSGMSSLRVLLLLLAALVLLTGVFAGKGALQDVHWDSPIYLNRSRAYAETPYLRDFAKHAQAIADHLRTYVVDQGDTAYWGFTRVGHSVLLGTVTSAFGPTLGAVTAAHLLYSALMAAAVLLSALTALGVMQTLGSGLSSTGRLAGAVVSGALYVASDIYRYMCGNLLADVPSLTFLAGSAALLAWGVASQSWMAAVASGMLAFAAYATKMDMVWVYASFLVAYGVALFTATSNRSWVRVFVLSAGTAFAAYCLFAAHFWPLPDPRLFVVWTKAQVGLPPNPHTPVRAIVAAGGMLWVGLLLGSLYRSREKSLWVALAWLTLLLLPYAQNVVLGKHTEVRYFVQLLLPLTLGSAVGWATLVDRGLAKRVHVATYAVLGAAILTIALISHLETYNWLRQLPGGWRLQYVRSWLGPPKYERPSYPVAELGEISRYVTAGSSPVLVFASETRLEEYFSIISFLAPYRAPVFTTDPDVPMELACGPRSIRPRTDPVMYCLLALPPEAGKLREAGVRLLELRDREVGAASAASAEHRVVFATQRLTLLEMDGSR